MIFLRGGEGRGPCVIADKIIGTDSVTPGGFLWNSLLISSYVLHGEQILPQNQEKQIFPANRQL